MIRKAGLVWDCELTFNRYIEDCGVQCETVTPQMIATPFYRGRYVSMVIPTGFGNPNYSGLLPALRASTSRIRTFVEKGGNLLVCGSMSSTPGTYDWLPIDVEYCHEYFTAHVHVNHESPFTSVLEDFDCTAVECDGHFTRFEGTPVATSEEGKTLMFSENVGKGSIVVMALHEYPSRSFLRAFCSHDKETLF
jgi:hypothetical protein